MKERLQSLIFPIVRLRTKYWLPSLLVAVSLGCSAEAETTARTETTDGTATGVAPVTPPTLAPTTTTDQSTRSKACRLGELEARIHVSARCVFYDVYGATLAKVASQLNGVRDDNGTWSAALMRKTVSWSGRNVGPTPCRLTSVSVRLTVEYTLPRWKPPRGVDPAAVAAWNRYLERLWQHERGHTRNGLGAARDVRSTLTRLPAAPDCRRLESVANKTVWRIIDRWKRQDVAYDSATDHGAATGAVLIP